MIFRLLCAFAMAFGSASPIVASITVTLTPNLAAPQPVGTSIVWTANAVDTDSGSHIYRFGAESNGAQAQILKDFAVDNTWTWTPSIFDAIFFVDVTVQNTTTLATGSTSVSYQISSQLAPGKSAAVNPTSNPLVALFSAPACAVPNSMRVRFSRSGDTTSQTTNLVPCRATGSLPDLSSMNFYIAGMYPSSVYLMNWETLKPSGTIVRSGVLIPFTSGSIPPGTSIPTISLIQPPPLADTLQPIMLQSYNSRETSYVETATDLQGNVVWYTNAAGISVDRTLMGGNMMYLQKGPVAGQSSLREIDLAGNVVVETNVARVSKQLVAAGFRRIADFNHEVRRISNPGKPNDGYIVVIGGSDMISTQYQGGTPTNPLDILGDEIIVLDRSLQLSWAWDPFAHLDVSRTAVLGETCTPSSVCKPLTPGFSLANDWLHTNTVQYNPWDENLVLSFRNQDWVIKIRYADGAGDGSVIWRLGPGGDFTITTKGTETTADIGFPWFSHQHDSEFELNGMLFGGRRVMTIYDDGNTRQATFDPNAHSRCQSYAVDETHLTVNLNISVDEGSYSQAEGSAQLLTNGNLSCSNGATANAISQTVENDKNGNLVFILQWPGVTYRTFRMKDMYTPITR